MADTGTEIPPPTEAAATSPRARDNALYMSLTGVIAITLASYFAYPLHESGAVTGLIVMSNVVSYLLGIKGALATPAKPTAG